MINLGMTQIANTDSVGVVYSTLNYGLFKFLERNRPIKMANVAKLRKSIECRGQLTPIQVRSDYSIIDGQTRFKALSELGKPILFIILNGAEEKDVIALNTARSNWSTGNYTHFYYDAPSYNALESFQQRHKLSTNAAHIILKSSFLSGILQSKFENGDFALSSDELVRGESRMDKISALCNLDNGRFKNKLLGAKMLKGLLAIIEHPNYSTGRMLAVLMKSPDHAVIGADSVGSAVTMLKNLYNKRLKELDKQILL